MSREHLTQPNASVKSIGDMIAFHFNGVMYILYSVKVMYVLMLKESHECRTTLD